MKAKLLIAALVSCAVIAGGVFLFVSKSNPNAPSGGATPSQNNTSDTTPDSPKLKAQTVGQLADCSTYTFDELSKVWGVPFVDTDINKVSELSTSGGKLYSCTYNQTDSGTGVSYVIEYREHPSVESAKQSMNDTRSTEKYGDKVYYLKEDKAGVGDEAFFWARNRTDGSKEANQQLYIRKGSVVFLLSGVNLSGVDASYKDKLVASYKLHFN
jgi:hypothetical protein